MDVPVAGAGGKPQAALLAVAAVAAILMLFSSSSGQFPLASGLFSSTGFGLTVAATGGLKGGSTSSRMGAAGEDGQGAAKGGGPASGPLQEIWTSVQNMLGMAPPPPVEMDDSSSSSESQGSTKKPRASGTTTKPEAAPSGTGGKGPTPSGTGGKWPTPSMTGGKGPGDAGGQEMRSPHSPTVAMTPPQGYDDGGHESGDDGKGGQAKEHKHRSWFHRHEDGERKHHFRSLFHHKDQKAEAEG